MSQPTEIQFQETDLETIAQAMGRVALIIDPEAGRSPCARRINRLTKGALDRALGSEAFGKLKAGDTMELAYPAGMECEALSLVVLPKKTGVIEARNVIAATGPFQRPIIPAVVPDSTGIVQMHSSGYRNPSQLPEGAVLVVGAGSSGVQIADELQRSGRQVYLSVGPHDRPPRAYRGRDFVWWLGVLGEWDARSVKPGMEHVTIAVSGAHGGRTVDFREFAARGMTRREELR